MRSAQRRKSVLDLHFDHTCSDKFESAWPIAAWDPEPFQDLIDPSPSEADDRTEAEDMPGFFDEYLPPAQQDSDKDSLLAVLESEAGQEVP